MGGMLFSLSVAACHAHTFTLRHEQCPTVLALSPLPEFGGCSDTKRGALRLRDHVPVRYRAHSEDSTGRPFICVAFVSG